MKKITFIGLLVLTVPAMLFAEATKEIYSDAGLYTGNPAGIFIMDFFPFFGGGGSQNGKAIIADTPEGKTAIHMQIDNSHGGFSLTNVFGGNKIARDYSGYQSGALRFWLRSNYQLKVEIEFGIGSKTGITLPSTNNQWVEHIIPFSAFPGVPINFAAVISPFILSTPGGPGEAYPIIFDVDHVRWTKPLNSIIILPAAVNVSSGKHRQFTAEGRDAAGDFVDIYPDWSAAGGTVNPMSKTRYTILEAGAAGGSVTASAEGKNGTAQFTIVPVSNEQFGIISDSVPGLKLDEDSKMITFRGDGDAIAQPVGLADDTAAPIEGIKSLKVTFNHTSPPPGARQPFSGLAVQWDKNPDTEHITKDMSAFYDGSIRFWLKGPANLRNFTEVGIRSGNVPAGVEVSKVPLRFYATFNDQWEPVVIPMSELVKAAPWADLTRMKIFFTLSAVGSTGGQNRSMYIDNVRWDTQKPGPVTSISIVPNSATVPNGYTNVFTVRGLDANGIPADVAATWSFVGSVLGTLTPATGASASVILSANSNGNSVLRATAGLLTANANVTVGPVVFNQSYNVYSDVGSGGFVGTSQFPAEDLPGNDTFIQLDELSGNAAEGNKFMRATYTLQNTPTKTDAFVVWFVGQPDEAGSRFMAFFDTGYLRFSVKTDRNLEISIRSANIPADENNAKILLGELGISLNNTWQNVIIPLSLFRNRDPRLDFSQVVTFFAVADTTAYGGETVNHAFDIDNVQWLVQNNNAPDILKVYQGLVEKQKPSGLLNSYETLPYGFTYDEALVAMVFTFRKDFAKTRSILNFYNSRLGGFDGFAEAYDVNTAAVLDTDRIVGPNAWLLLAIIHYRNASGDITYDNMMNTLANWIKSFQAADGAVTFGKPQNGIPAGTKSTEHNFDAYAAFKAYFDITQNAAFNTSANSVLNWLQTEAWNAPQQRFNVGESAGGSPDAGKALDVYSWAPLAIGPYTTLPVGMPLLEKAEADFLNTKINSVNGEEITGFDFGGPGPTPDKDAVWLEGTAQMALAYRLVGGLTKSENYLNQLRKAVFIISSTAQGLTYATNGGTAYGGFPMDATNAAVSSMAWYLFASEEFNFNPFHPRPLHGIRTRSINEAGNPVTSGLSWNLPSVPTGDATWIRANEYIEMYSQPVTVDAWGIQIYTDNKRTSASPKFMDPTENDGNNPDSDPAGLLFVPQVGTETSVKLPLAWSVKETTEPATLPVAADPNHTGVGDLACFPENLNSFQWFFMKDRGTPAIQFNPCNATDGGPVSPAFADGDEYIRVARKLNDANLQRTQIKTVQAEPGLGFFSSYTPDFIFVEADFATAAAQSQYSTTIFIEFYLE